MSMLWVHALHASDAHAAQLQLTKLMPTLANCSKAHITAHPLLDFCLEAVKDVADLPPAEAAESGPRATKKRSKYDYC